MRDADDAVMTAVGQVVSVPQMITVVGRENIVLL